ncbi:MAG TPA: hypothetical protein VFO05_02945 [Candidatus Limnocylindrales bacterium]|nr:hypothetical protein [Candidatus Limnocylindrales bacterium]
MKIDWLTTILTIVGALIGDAIAANVPFLRDLIPIFGTSVGALLTILVCGGIGGAIAGAMGSRSAV